VAYEDKQTRKEYLREYSRRWRHKNPERVRLASRKYFKKNTEKVRLKHREYYLKNRERIQLRQKNSRRTWKSNWKRNRRLLRSEFIENYGGACECCGEKTAEFLTMEHKKNNGAEERRLYGRRGATLRILQKLHRLGWPKTEEYGILCFNCNCAKAFSPGHICPHKRSVASGVNVGDNE